MVQWAPWGQVCTNMVRLRAGTQRLFGKYLIVCYIFGYNDTGAAGFFSLSRHGALPFVGVGKSAREWLRWGRYVGRGMASMGWVRPEEHTSEHQLEPVRGWRLLLDKISKTERDWIGCRGYDS